MQPASLSLFRFFSFSFFISIFLSLFRSRFSAFHRVSFSDGVPSFYRPSRMVRRYVCRFAPLLPCLSSAYPRPLSPFLFLSVSQTGSHRKQSYKALMLRVTTVKHFNLFDAIASDGTACGSAWPSSDRESDFRMNFPDMPNTESNHEHWRKKRQRMINHVSYISWHFPDTSILSESRLHFSLPPYTEFCVRLCTLNMLTKLSEIRDNRQWK